MIEDETDDDSEAAHHVQLPPSYHSQSQPLKVKVQPSETFYDTPQHNRHLEFYSTRSKKRGRLLIINNFKFSKEGKTNGYRNGADVDNANLVTLFKQMGGWDIVLEINKTAAVSNFTTDQKSLMYLNNFKV